MKDKLSITLFGETFLIFEQPHYQPIRPEYAKYSTIYQAYKCPSAEKVRVYNYWVQWFTLMFSPKYGIYNSNCHKFSMCGIVWIDDEEYFAYISKSRRLLFKL